MTTFVILLLFSLIFSKVLFSNPKFHKTYSISFDHLSVINELRNSSFQVVHEISHTVIH